MDNLFPSILLFQIIPLAILLLGVAFAFRSGGQS